MSYFRRFAFFDKVELNVNKSERAFQDLPVTCVSSGGSYLWLGDVDGFMHCIDNAFTFTSFRAHNAGSVRLCRQVPGAESYLLVTVGVSVDENINKAVRKEEEERVCVWNTKKWSLASKNSSPVCCRSFKTSMTASTSATAAASSSLGEVVCLDVGATMDAILLGYSSGIVQLIKGDITSDRHCRRVLLYSFTAPVTNLHYVPATFVSTTNTKRGKSIRGHGQTALDSDTGSISSATLPASSTVPFGAYLYATTENELVAIRLGKQDEPVQTTILETFGCHPNCSCLLMDPNKPGRKLLAMTHKEAVYFYNLDRRGLCVAIEGSKRAITVYRNYIVSIKHSRSDANRPDLLDAQSSVSLFEYRNKFTGGDFIIPWAHSIVTGFGGLFVLCVENGSRVKLVELVEKNTQSMLDILFSRKSFNLAIGIAESNNYGEEELAHIHRRYADHLFNQKQYDLAVKEYIQTIGTIEASYVVLRFLECGLITHLTHYLEALHQPDNMARGCLTKDHTILLFNSYARLDDKERIDAFLDKLVDQSQVSSEFSSCIHVLRRAGYSLQALRLAKITNNPTSCIRILAEDLKNAEAALKEISLLPFEQALEAVCSYGVFLMQSAPSETAELLDRLCSDPMSGQISAQHFIKIFVNNRLGLMKFLERYIQKSDSNNVALANVVETLLELLLHEAHVLASNELTVDQQELQLAHLHGLIFRLLEDPKANYDEGKVLLLFKQRNFVPGCLYIWMKNRQFDQIIEHYILEDNFDEILKTCEKYGDEVPSLWLDAFKYVADRPELGNQLPRILSEIDSRNLASPLVLLQLLTSGSSAKCHTFGSVKAYLLRFFESNKVKVETNEAEMQRLREETLRNREVARQSKTRVKIFQQQKCAVCNQALEPPSIYFLCDHSYHKSCFDTYSSGDQLCPECAPLIRRGLMEAGKMASNSSKAGSESVLDELKLSLGMEKADLSQALSNAIARGVASIPSPVVSTKHAPQPKTPPTRTSRSSVVASTNPFAEVLADKAMELGHSGRSAMKQPAPKSVSTIDSGVVLSMSKSSKVASNPFGADDVENDSKEEGAESKNRTQITYPQHLNPF